MASIRYADVRSALRCHLPERSTVDAIVKSADGGVAVSGRGELLPLYRCLVPAKTPSRTLYDTERRPKLPEEAGFG